MKLLVTSFLLNVPLSRGGAKDCAAAGVCLPAFTSALLTHPSTPLKRGIAQANAFLAALFFFSNPLAAEILSKLHLSKISL
jgi:hypothetical protein